MMDGGSFDVEPVTAEPPALDRRPVLRQRWCELAYFHWRYDPDAVQRLLPPGVTVDTFDGSAWVGLIPFTMRDVAIGPTPAVPWLGTFIEINVRTYVVDPLGRRAVWFFSLDVPRLAIVGVARTAFALPYCWSAADHSVVEPRDADGPDGAQHRYTMRRRWPGARPGRRPSADIRFTVGGRIPEAEETELDHFLSARWALVTTRGEQPLYGRVHHERWPLHRIDGHDVRQDVVEAAGLPSPEGPIHALYAPEVHVRIPWFEKVEEPIVAEDDTGRDTP